MKKFNRNTVKISYSCTNNIYKIIYNHNRKLLDKSHMDDKRAQILLCDLKKKRKKNTPCIEGVLPKTYDTKLSFSPWKIEVIREYT